MATKVLVPPLGQTVDSVMLVAWHRNEGDTVKQGEMLFSIETDKAILDIEAPASGVLRQVTGQPGDEVQVLYPGSDVSEADLRTEIESALKRAAPGFLKTVGLWTPSHTLPRRVRSWKGDRWTGNGKSQCPAQPVTRPRSSHARLPTGSLSRPERGGWLKTTTLP